MRTQGAWNKNTQVLEQPRLIFVLSRHRVAGPAARLVGVLAADHDDRRVVARRSAVDEPLVAARWVAADDADRMQLVHDLGDGEQLRHWTERLAAEIGVRPG